MKTLGLIFLILFLIFCITGVIWCMRSERKDWNHGICPYCGEKLKHFADDSQGGHGWCCNKCDYYTWVSYHRFVYKTKNN